METYEYRTISSPAAGIYREKGSKFIACLEPVLTEEDCRNFLSRMRKEYHDARHHCYAYRIEPENEVSKSSDDGEPSGTAGKPILNQILSAELCNVMIVVVRYFGGTKLGVSGLINAYKTSAREAIQNAGIIVRHLTRQYELRFEYPKINEVMRVIKEEDLGILEQDFALSCVIKIEIKKNQLEKAILKLDNLRNVEIKSLENSRV